MKKDVFNKCVSIVTKHFGITKKKLFARTKQQNIVDARQLLYYLSLEKGIRLVYLKIFLKENGYIGNNSSIYGGIKTVNQKILSDEHYANNVKKIVQSL